MNEAFRASVTEAQMEKDFAEDKVKVMDFRWRWVYYSDRIVGFARNDFKHDY